MLTLDLKSRLRNKAFIAAFISAIVLLIQQLGFKQYIPANYLDILNSVISILVMLGIVVDTSTPGISDKNVLPNEQGVTNVQDLVKEMEVILDNKGMTTTGDIKVVSQDGSSQMTVKDDSINSIVQANAVDIEALEKQKADIQSQIDAAKAQV